MKRSVTWLGMRSLLGLLSRFSGRSPYDYACACVDNTSVSNVPWAPREPGPRGLPETGVSLGRDSPGGAPPGGRRAAQRGIVIHGKRQATPKDFRLYRCAKVLSLLTYHI